MGKNVEKTKLLTFLFSTLLLVQCNIYNQNKEFECYEYYLPTDINWEYAYDNIMFSSDPMLLKDRLSRWAIIFPGSVQLNMDTIYISQESGYPNKCTLIGNLNPGDSSYLSNNTLFKLIDDSIILFDGKKYIKTKNYVKFGCWCDWK